MSLPVVVEFLNSHNIIYVDSQTTIISRIPSQLQQSKQQQSAECYLIKDMLVPECQSPETSDKNLESIIETLKMHQNLSNKYILTLLHYQTFMKTVSVPIGPGRTHSRSQSHHNSQFVEERNLSQEYSRSQSQSNLRMSKSGVASKDKKTQIYDSRSVSQSSVLNRDPCPEPSCTTTHKAIRAIYQYGPLTLKDQIGNRVASCTQFQEEQLWAILATITQAISYLQQQEIVYGVLGTDRIFINRSLVKIIDPSATATDPMLVVQGRLYSPEVLDGEDNIDMFKSDIYVTGLIMLECGLLIDLSKQIQPNLTKYLDVFKTIYSEQLSHVVEMCLARSPQDRPNFSELRQYLKKELDMNDFSNAYENRDDGLSFLQPDIQDIPNSQVEAIAQQKQGEQFNTDLLWETIGLDSRREVVDKANRTQYDRAREKFLGFDYQSQSRYHQVQDVQESSDESYHEQRNSHRHRGSGNRVGSPKIRETRRQIPNKSKQPYPSINVKISESVYGQEMHVIPNSVKNKEMLKTNRKVFSQENENVENRKRSAHRKQNREQENLGNRKQSNICKIKKTKHIKQKLIRNYEDSYREQPLQRQSKQRGLTENRNILNANSKEQLRQYCKYEHRGDSIQEQMQEQSESSCLYYNKNSKVSRNSNSQDHSRSSGNADQSERSQYGASGESHSVDKQRNTANRFDFSKFTQDNQHLFTHPNLMKTIKQDLENLSKIRR